MRRLLPLFIVFLLFSGCISESSYSDKQTENLLSSTSYDEDGDGVTDFYHYIFEEQEHEGYSIQREVYVYPNNLLSSFNFNLLDEQEVIDILTLFDSFSDDLKTDFDDCSAKLGIASTKCANIEHCASKCSETTECKKLAESYPEFMGYLVLSLDEASSERKTLSNSINSDLWAYEDLSAAKKQGLFDDLTSLYLLSVSVINGPLFTHNEVGICTNSLSYENYVELFSILGSESISTSEYNYLVVLHVSGLEAEENEYQDLFVKDAISVPFDSDSIYYVQDAVLKNSEIEFSPLRSDKTEEIFFYSFGSSEDPSLVVWETPQYKSRDINLLFLQPSFFVFGLSLPITNYFLAVSLAIAIPAILLILLVNIVLLVYNLLVAKIRMNSFYRAMKNFVGIPNLSWKKDLMFGLVLFAVGVGASFFAMHVPDQSIQIFQLMDYMFEDYAALISIFCTVVGALFIYVSVQSIVKAMLLQFSYAGVVKKEKEVALHEVDELKEKLEILKNMIDEYKKEGFDISEAYTVYVSVPAEQLSKVTKGNIEEKATFIERSLNKVENVISMMKERKENAEKNWHAWSEQIFEKIQKDHEVYLSNLVFIPVSLRTWAANKFIAEHPNDGIFFEGNVLKQKEVAPTELVNAAIKSGNVLNAVILKNGKPFLTIVTSGNRTVVEGLFLKLSTYVRTFLKKSNQKEYKYVMGIGDKVVFALVQRGDLESLIVCPTDKFKDGFEQWKEILNNIQSA